MCNNENAYVLIHPKPGRCKKMDDYTPAHKISATVQTLHIEHLIIQCEHLLFVRDRHLQWVSETNDLAIREMHDDISNVLDQLASQYELLIAALQKQRQRDEEE
jgi:hypothetical protein